jgi:hypothetical protein
MLSMSRTRMIDFIITLALWVWYIMGYLLFFSPFYLYAYFFSKRKEESFQRLNHRLHQLFFTLVRTLIPRVRWRITEEVSALRSSIIIANHHSFLDPILFVSLYEKQKTIVKKDYFGYPVFGWILNVSGYMPALTNDGFSDAMMTQIKRQPLYCPGGDKKSRRQHRSIRQGGLPHRPPLPGAHRGRVHPEHGQALSSGQPVIQYVRRLCNRRGTGRATHARL